MDARIVSAVSIMEQRLGQRVRMAELAREVGLSQSAFTRLFRRETGATPRRYIHTLRLRRAEHLLAATPLRIRDVMTLVGMGHAGHFARDFRRYHGINPRAVQRKPPPLH
jgi:AraC family transcriptional regulator